MISAGDFRNGMTFEDAFKVVSYLSDKVEKYFLDYKIL